MSRTFTAAKELAELREEHSRLEELCIVRLRDGPQSDVPALEAQLAILQEKIHEMESVLEFHGERRQLLNATELFQLAYHSDRFDFSTTSNSVSTSFTHVSETPLNKSSASMEKGSAAMNNTKKQPASRPRQGLYEKIYLTDPERAGEALHTELMPIDLEQYCQDVSLWAQRNLANRITGVLLATAEHFFGIIEGPKEAVLKTFEAIEKDERHKNVTKIHTVFVESRSFSDGMRLAVVEDGLMASILDDMVKLAQRAAVFVPAPVRDIVVRGGHSLSTLPESQDRIVLCVMLDTLCGALHRADRYCAASKIIENAVMSRGGFVADRFGESMSCYWPLHSTTTPVMHAVVEIHSKVPYAVMSVSVGSVTMVNLPHCSAFGEGLREGVQLLLHAEKNRHPLLVTEAAWSRCNRAVHRFQNFTIDLVEFFTLMSLANERLEAPPEPDIIGKYVPGPEPAAHVHVGPTQVATAMGQRATPSDLEAGRKAQAIARGSVSTAELQRLFRQMDMGNCGWVGKTQLKQEIKTNDMFPTYLLDEERLDKWLDRCNKLGDSRVSFDEFVVVCMKLQSM